MSHNFRVVSACNQVFEPAALFADRLPRALAASAPRVVTIEGREEWRFEGRVPQLEAWSSRRPATTIHVSLHRAGDGAAYLADMALDGVDAAVVYPGVAHVVYEMQDRSLGSACVRAYNDWLLDEFCSADRSRLVGVCLLPMHDEVEATCVEVARVLAKGGRAFLMPLHPARPLFDRAHDPLWKCVSDAGAVICLRSRAELLDEGAVAAPGARLGPLRNAQLALRGFSMASSLTQLIFAGVFERFAALKVVAADADLGWVPYWRQQLRRSIVTPVLPEQRGYAERPNPERTLGKNVFFTLGEDKVGFQLAALDRGLSSAGMFATGYPSAFSSWPRTALLLPELTRHMPEPARHALLAGNALRVFNLERGAASAPPV